VGTGRGRLADVPRMARLRREPGQPKTVVAGLAHFDSPAARNQQPTRRTARGLWPYTTRQARCTIALLFRESFHG